MATRGHTSFGCRFVWDFFVGKDLHSGGKITTGNNLHLFEEQYRACYSGDRVLRTDASRHTFLLVGENARQLFGGRCRIANAIFLSTDFVLLNFSCNDPVFIFS